MDIYEAYDAFEMPDGYPFYTTRIQYNAPALPGGDAGCFPAAHPRPTLDAELRAGDKVRITLKNHAFDGETGIITRVPNLPFNEYTVEFEGFGQCWYKRSEFEVIEPAKILDEHYDAWLDNLNNTSRLQPHAGEVYLKRHLRRLGTRVLVLSSADESSQGWFVYGLPVYRDGSYGSPMMIALTREDVLLNTIRLPDCGKLALRRYRAIQRKSHAAYVNDDSCERDGYYFARGI